MVGEQRINAVGTGGRRDRPLVAAEGERRPAAALSGLDPDHPSTGARILATRRSTCALVL
jgi:hypothetical protein